MYEELVYKVPEDFAAYSSGGIQFLDFGAKMPIRLQLYIY